MYDYVVVYVDDLFVSMTNPQHFFDDLQSPPYNNKLKGVGEPPYHLRTDFLHDSDGTLCMGSQTYVKWFLSTYKNYLVNSLILFSLDLLKTITLNSIQPNSVLLNECCQIPISHWGLPMVNLLGPVRSC